MKLTYPLSLSLFSCIFFGVHAGSVTKNGTVCTVEASGNGTDDTPAIVSAFQQCNTSSTIVFQNTTYNVEQVMDTRGLNNVTIDMQGTLVWGMNTSYWRNNSLQLGYQNQTTAWRFGGTNITWDGHGYGTFDGNGQIWYDLANGTSNLPGRPISLTISNTTNATFTGIRFVQSQFWTMAITYSDSVLLEDIYVNSTSNTTTGTTINTDGCDTFYSNNITFRRWDITNGDDNFAPKANSSNLIIDNCTFHSGNGVAIGSIGQYLNTFEFIENLTATNIVAENTLYAAYVKTWTGVQQNYPPNGGGGGIGYVKNLVFQNFTLSNVSTVAEITQCTSYSGATGECDTSKFQISNVTWGPMNGTVDSLAEFQCSGAAPCPGIQLIGFDQITTYNGTRNITCSNVENPVGFNCTTGS